MSDIMPTAELAWTQDLPKISGHYFILCPFHTKPSLEKLGVDSDGDVLGLDSGDHAESEYLEDHKNWYYGPIPVPTIPAQVIAAHRMLNSTGKGMS